MPPLRSNPGRMTIAQGGFRHRLKHRWREGLLLFLSTAMFAISVLGMPFLFERQDEEWLRWSGRLDDPARPLELVERFYQFNTDARRWVAVVSDFPFVYTRDQLRINRPVYPALCSLVARVASLVLRWPDWRAAMLEPTGFALSFASILTINYLIVVMSVQVFFAWLKRHLAVSTSLIGATLFALWPWWLWQANQAATSVAAVGIIVLVLHLFDNLLGERPPSWAQIARYSLLMGILMLAKAQYDALFAGWLWAAYERRWRVLGGTFLLHWLPLLLWIGVLGLAGLSYYNHEISVYEGRGWLLSMMAQGDLRALYLYITDVLGGVLTSFLRTFSPLPIALFVWGLTREEAGVTIKRRAMLGLLAIAAFLITVRKTSLVFDAFFVVYPLAAVGLSDIATRCTSLRAFRRWQPSLVFGWMVVLFFVVNTAVSWYLSLRWPFRPALGELLILLSRLTSRATR